MGVHGGLNAQGATESHPRLVECAPAPYMSASLRHITLTSARRTCLYEDRPRQLALTQTAVSDSWHWQCPDTDRTASRQPRGSRHRTHVLHRNSSHTSIKDYCIRVQGTSNGPVWFLFSPTCFNTTSCRNNCTHTRRTAANKISNHGRDSDYLNITVCLTRSGNAALHLHLSQVPRQALIAKGIELQPGPTSSTDMERTYEVRGSKSRPCPAPPTVHEVDEDIISWIEQIHDWRRVVHGITMR